MPNSYIALVSFISLLQHVENMKIFPSLSISNKKVSADKNALDSALEAKNDQKPIVTPNGKLLNSASKSKKIVATILAVTSLLGIVSAEQPDQSIKKEASETVQNSKNTNGFFDDKTGFFNEDSANTVFAPQPSLENPLEVGFFKEHAIHDDLNNDFAAEPLQDNSKLVDTKPNNQRNFKGATVDDLRKEFGDPKEDTALKAVDNAPKPFKAIMASLDAGHKEEAFAYAKQYARYLRNVTKLTNDVVNLSGLAMEREGIVPAKKVGPKGDGNPYRYLLDQDYMREEDVKGAGLPSTGTNAQAKKMIDQALAEVDSGNVKEGN